jgi:hypothetical protein
VIKGSIVAKQYELAMKVGILNSRMEDSQEIFLVV